MRVEGIHHVTLLVRDLDRTRAFYADVLGLALLEETRNPDDPSARHFWFGDRERGLVSFLEYPELPAGTVGAGSTHHLALAVASADELAGWREKLQALGVHTTDVLERAGLRSLYLRDPDGHLLELAAPGGRGAASPGVPGA